MGFGYCACHGAPAHPEPTSHQCYDVVLSLTSKDNGQLADGAAGTLSPPSCSCSLLPLSRSHARAGVWLCFGHTHPCRTSCESQEEGGLVVQTPLWFGEDWERSGPGRSPFTRASTLVSACSRGQTDSRGWEEAHLQQTECNLHSRRVMRYIASRPVMSICHKQRLF